jgi:hypothetical protein
MPLTKQGAASASLFSSERAGKAEKNEVLIDRILSRSCGVHPVGRDGVSGPVPALARFGPRSSPGLRATLARAKRDEAEKKRNLPPLAQVFLRFGDFQEMRNCRAGRTIATFLTVDIIKRNDLAVSSSHDAASRKAMSKYAHRACSRAGSFSSNNGSCATSTSLVCHAPTWFVPPANDTRQKPPVS